MEHRFHFKRGDLEVTFSGERAFVETQVAAYMDALLRGLEAPRLALDVRPQPSSEDAPGVDAIAQFPRVDPGFRPKRNVSLADFAALKAATAPTDLVVVAGYYMEKYMQQEAYSPADLQGQLQALPSWDCQVVDEVLPVTVMQGYMEQLRDERYTLTYKGQTYVRDGLS